MICPRCNGLMILEGIEEVHGDSIYENWACTSCAHHIHRKRPGSSEQN